MLSLRLDRNRLVSLPDLSLNVKLRLLDVSSNWLLNVPDLTTLVHLWYFNASNNILKELPAFGSHNLTVVDVCSNTFTQPQRGVRLTGPRSARVCGCCHGRSFQE